MAGRFHMDWHGSEFLAAVNDDLRKRLKTAAEVVRARAVKLIAKSVFETVTVISKTKNGKERSRKLKITVRSRPGEPPRKETGTLQKSVVYEVDVGQLVARVGSNLKYALWLEVGTKSRGGKAVMAPRPWLSRALREMQGRIAAIFTKPGPLK